MSKEACHVDAYESSSTCFQGKKESQEEDSCRCSEINDVDSLEDEWIVQEGDKEFYKNLNSIILQYFDISGLDQSYRTFYDECQTVGYLLPQSWGAEPQSSSSRVEMEDIDRLVRYFDDENGTGLLDLWDSIMQSLQCGIGRHTETFKISVYIHIYVALIPFRRNLPNEEKMRSMQRLRDYFQSKTDDCTKDEEVLKYFALPFVHDPHAHPFFSKLLTDSWIEEVRARLRTLVMTIDRKKQPISPLESDLAQLFLSWSESVQHTVELEHGHSWTLQTTPHPVTLTSNASFNMKSLKNDNPLRKFFENIDEVTEDNRRLKIKETESEQKYSQLLNFCAVLVGYLVEACQGKSVDMVQLKTSICDVFPQMVHTNELRRTQANTEKTDPVKTTREKDLHHRKRILHNRNRNHSHRQNVYTTLKIEDSMTKHEEKEQPQVKDIPGSHCQHEYQCSNYYHADLPAKTPIVDNIITAGNDEAPSAKCCSKISSSTRSHIRLPKNQSKSYRCDSSGRNEETQSPLSSCSSRIELTYSELELLDAAGKNNARPRTYELESVQSPQFKTKDASDDQIISNVRGAVHSSRKLENENDTGVTEFQGGTNQDYLQHCSSQRRTYRVRVIDAIGVSNSSNGNSTIRDDPVKNNLFLSCDSSIDSFSNSKQSSHIKSLDFKGDHNLEISLIDECSARANFSGDTGTQIARRYPTISSTKNDIPGISNNNPSWKTVSHTADSIPINGQPVEKERSSQTIDAIATRSNLRRSLSDTNIGRKS